MIAHCCAPGVGEDEGCVWGGGSVTGARKAPSQERLRHRSKEGAPSQEQGRGSVAGARAVCVERITAQFWLDF